MDVAEGNCSALSGGITTTRRGHSPREASPPAAVGL